MWLAWIAIAVIIIFNLMFVYLSNYFDNSTNIKYMYTREALAQMYIWLN